MHSQVNSQFCKLPLNKKRENQIAFDRTMQEITELKILLENAHRKAQHYANLLYGKNNNKGLDK